MEYLIILTLIFISLSFFFYRNKQKKLALLLERNKESIEEGTQTFEGYLNRTRFFNHRKLILWKEKYKFLCDSLPKKVSYLRLQKDLIKNIKSLKDYYIHSERYRDESNKKFIASEIEKNRNLFDTVEKYPLTIKQREAIVSDEDNNLIIAGAGTGKTSTLLGKIIYLINSLNVKSEKILVLAFTRKASEEIRERVKSRINVDMDIKTFHKFGLDVIGSAEGEKPSLAFTDEFRDELNNFIFSIFTELIKTSSYQELISIYFLSFLRPYKSPEAYKTQGDYFKSLRNYRTFKGEILKSFEEVEIADFLYVNNIDYIYEQEYKHKTVSVEYSQYKPDFYLPKYKIYIEHFGLIDRNGNVPHWFSSKGNKSAKESYNDSINWKRSTHRKYHTILVETFSFEKKEGRLLELLKERLSHHGVEFSATPAQIIKHYEEKKEFPAFINLVITFLNLMKSNGFSIEVLNSLVKQKKLKREEKFLEIFEPIYNNYQTYLHENNNIDFSDMIIKAADHIESKKYTSPYEYILIDEFQDMSVGRYKLISNLLKQNPDQRMFCVGDDWQSIYRFTGSDISIITEFEKYFGFTRRIDLDLSFRLDNKVSAFTQKFILKNPKQLRKNLISSKNIKDEPFEVVYENNLDALKDVGDNDSPKTALEVCLDKIKSNVLGTDKKKIFILGRYNFDSPAQLSELKKKFSSFDINFLTAHSSKGLEADYVILTNINSGKYGFPSEIVDDPLLGMVLQMQDEIENAEERRLFYVALTRTKNNIYIICNKNNSSKFVVELLTENKLLNRCPKCRDGMLIKRKNSKDQSEFLGCENYPLCDFTKRI